MRLFELHLTEGKQAGYRNLKDFGGQSRARWETSVHQRFRSSSSRHVVRHWQRRCELLPDKEVEDLVRVGCLPTENHPSKLFEGDEILKVLWVAITDSFKYPRSNGGHFILCRDSEKG